MLLTEELLRERLWDQLSRGMQGPEPDGPETVQAAPAAGLASRLMQTLRRRPEAAADTVVN